MEYKPLKFEMELISQNDTKFKLTSFLLEEH
ncbi:hypothetical protein EV695_0494 [Cocleimonas flava]|uniref:Uncharacterized protein n=1 Tax=Cocleimonas flava TaxID=634765 RepID=A0A4R1F352_9GAMM|nr:hypothetical protein EV695_0494 [Cocleimonas flava]